MHPSPLPGRAVPGASTPPRPQETPSPPSSLSTRPASGPSRFTSSATCPSPRAMTQSFPCGSGGHAPGPSSGRNVSFRPLAQRLSVQFPHGCELLYMCRVTPGLRRYRPEAGFSARTSEPAPVAAFRSSRSRKSFSPRRARTSAWQSRTVSPRRSFRIAASAMNFVPAPSATARSSAGAAGSSGGRDSTKPARTAWPPCNRAAAPPSSGATRPSRPSSALRTSWATRSASSQVLTRPFSADLSPAEAMGHGRCGARRRTRQREPPRRPGPGGVARGGEGGGRAPGGQLKGQAGRASPEGAPPSTLHAAGREGCRRGPDLTVGRSLDLLTTGFGRPLRLLLLGAWGWENTLGTCG